MIGAVALAAACRPSAALGADAVSAHEGALVGRLTGGLACDRGRAHPPAVAVGVRRALAMQP